MLLWVAVSLFSNSSNGDSNREPDGSGGDKKKAADTSNSGGALADISHLTAWWRCEISSVARKCAGRAAKSLFDRKELINLCRLAVSLSI